MDQYVIPALTAKDEHAGDLVLEEALVESPLHRFDRVSGLRAAAGPRQQSCHAFSFTH